MSIFCSWGCGERMLSAPSQMDHEQRECPLRPEALRARIDLLERALRSMTRLARDAGRENEVGFDGPREKKIDRILRGVKP